MLLLTGDMAVFRHKVISGAQMFPSFVPLSDIDARLRHAGSGGRAGGRGSVQELGTAVELNAESQGTFVFVYRDRVNASLSGNSGCLLPPTDRTHPNPPPYINKEGLNWEDEDDGLGCPDVCVLPRPEPSPTLSTDMCSPSP